MSGIKWLNLIIGTLHRRKKSGRPSKCSERDEKLLVRIVKRDPTATSSNVISHANQFLGLGISKWTANRILRRAKIFARRPCSKPLLNSRQKRARLEFARLHMHWTPQDWAKVLWSDETKVNMHNPDGGQWVRRPSGERHNTKYIKTSVKFGGGSILAWG